MCPGISSLRDAEAGQVAGWGRRQCSETCEGLPWVVGGSDHSLLLRHNHWEAGDIDCIPVQAVAYCCTVVVVAVDTGVAASVAAVVVSVAVAIVVVVSVAAVASSFVVAVSHAVAAVGTFVAVVVDIAAVAVEAGWHKVVAHCQYSWTCCWSG